MKLLKRLVGNIYFLLARPLLKRLELEFISRLESERIASAEKLNILEGKVAELMDSHEQQKKYLKRLEEAGLHDVLVRESRADYHSSKVVIALTDLLSGVETSAVAEKYGIPADVLMRWNKLWQCPAWGCNTVSGSTNDFEKPDSYLVELYERQLVFNGERAKQMQDILRVRCARLQKKLDLANAASPGRLVDP